MTRAADAGHVPASYGSCPECDAGRLAAGSRASLLRGIVDDLFALAIVGASLAACALAALALAAVWTVLS